MIQKEVSKIASLFASSIALYVMWESEKKKDIHKEILVRYETLSGQRIIGKISKKKKKILRK